MASRAWGRSLQAQPTPRVSWVSLISLAAVQLIPTWELSRLSVRAGGLPFNERLSFSLTPLYLARALLPGFVEPVSPEHIEHVAYVGITGLALAAIAMRIKSPIQNLKSLILLLVVGLFLSLGLYNPEELGGLPVGKFIEAVAAEGGRCGRGINAPLHVHPVFNEADIYGDGKPTRIAFSDHDMRQPAGSLPIAEGIAERTYGIPYFKYYQPEEIERYAAAFRKVALQAEKLL